MTSYGQKFDAKAYWDAKPYCSVCKKRKVKTGSVCYECKKTNISEQEYSQRSKTNTSETNELIGKTIGDKQKISEIKFDKNFIKRLLDKLKIGNSRSIHLNALPGRSATRMDLFQLSEIDPGLPMDFIKTIATSESFSFKISFDKLDLSDLDDEQKKKLGLITKRLNAIVIEKEDNFLEFGLKNFGFGYPLLIKRDQNDPTKIIKAPLFIWSLDIERSYQNKNSWTIKKDEDSPIKINELLASHLSKDESIKIEKISQEVLEDGVLDETEIQGMIKEIMSQLNVQIDKPELKIEKSPDAKEIEDISNSKPWIQWSGIFGIYRSQNETIINSTEELLERFDEFESEKLELEQFQTSSITAVETDPSKEEIVNTLTKDEIKLIQGPPGTGKSQSITAIVSNALANNAKCLIVCEKKTALDVIYKNLEKMHLDQFSIVIDDVNRDRRKIIQKARDINENPYYGSFPEKDYEVKYEKFCELKKEVNLKSAETLSKVFGDFSWKQLIGLFLRFSKSDELKKLINGLEYKNLKFENQEYAKYLSEIEESIFLFDDMEKDSDNSFLHINKSLFLETYKSATKETIRNTAEEIFIVAKSADDFLNHVKKTGCEEGKISIFKPKSIDEALLLVANVIKNQKELISLYEEGIDLSGGDFNKKGLFQNVKYQFSSIFNSKNKRLRIIRKNIPKKIRETVSFLIKLNEQGFDNLKIKDFETRESCKELKKNCSDLLAKTRKIELSLKILNERSIKVQQFCADLEKMVAKGILDFKACSFSSGFDSLTKYFKEIYTSVDNLQNHLDAYESYHNWRFFCSKKDVIFLAIIDILKTIPLEKWKDVFVAWYYRGALQNYENKTQVGFHKSSSKLEQLSVLYHELSDAQTQQIKSNWGNIRRSQLSRARDNYNFNTLYNLRKNNAGPKSSLRKIINVDFDLFTSLFPVILTNPVAANAILPLEQGLFNIVIFDEASQLRISDTFTSLIRGQYKIIAGDEHQMPPSSYFQSTAELLEGEESEDETTTEEDEQAVLAESESLLQFGADLSNVNKSYLDFHYRSNHPELIEFSNCAFYGGNLVPFPAKEVYKPIEFRPVNGRYEMRTNPLEVIEIIKIIKNEIHPDQNGKYPSVGIATFNLNQRNLITEALNESAEKDSAFNKKLLELRERGLFVKNLENIQGDERDIIIISTTYGIQADGRFSQNFARINRMEGYKLLNVLITRAKHKIYVCTSIPKDKYLTYAENIESEGNNKRGILYAYLAYSEAISNHNTEVAENILRLLKDHSYERPRIQSITDGLSESPFEEEVYEILLEHFKPEDIIQQHKVGGFRLDFVIKTKFKDIILECDGKEYHQSEEAYAHDMYRQKELEDMGYCVYRIWSTNWFQDKEIEMQKLVRFVESLR